MRSLLGTVINRVVNQSTPQRGIPFRTAGLGSSGNPAKMEALMGTLGSVGTLFAIVGQITNAVAKTQWNLFRRSTLREEDEQEQVTTHAALTLWRKPNPFYTGRFFRESVQQHIELVGEGVILLVRNRGVVVEMWPLRPDKIEPVPHRTKFLAGYVYTGASGEQVPLEVQDIIHIKLPNPLDPYRGMGAVQSVLADLDASRFSAEWNRNFFINGARPGGIIKMDRRLDDDEFDELLQRWRFQHQGVANAHRVAILEAGEWIDTNFTMQDMQFAELRNLPRELIREAFAFPKFMLGTVDDVNRANANASEEVFARWLTVPRLDRWKDVLDEQFLPMFANGPNLELKYINPVPISREAEDRERNSKAQSAQRLVDAGYAPEDVLQAMGLPEMRHVREPNGLSRGDNGNSNQATAATAIALR